ncbi:MAG: hypothetical protein ABI871_05695 [Chthoniobacterales bacterium]
MTDREKQGSQYRSGRGDRQAARRRRLIAWAGVLCLVLAAISSAKPVYHWMKARRASQFTAAGEELVRSGKLEEAASKYRAALQLDPLGYRPLSGAARLATITHRPEAADLWEQVARLPDCTTTDRQDYAAVLLDNGRTADAERIIGELVKANPDTRTLFLAGRFSEQNGNRVKAIEFARAAFSRAPGDAPAAFQLAELLASSPASEQHAEAREILWSIAGKPGPMQKAALEAIARSPDLPADEQERALNALNGLAAPSAADTLLGFDLQLRLHPAQADEIYEQSKARFASSGPPDLALLARWLNAHRQFERVLALLPPETAVTNDAFLLARLDALGATLRWPDAEALLARPDLALHPAVAECFRARIALAQNASLDADSHWNKAIGAATGDPAKLRFVANFAEQNKVPAVARLAYEQLARFPEHAAFAYRGTQRLAEKGGDTKVARAAAERLAAVAPHDANAQNQLVYLDLLLGNDLEGNAAKAQQFTARDPSRLSFRITAAFAFLRRHDFPSALAQFRGPPIEWKRTPPAWRAVFAATLLAADKRKDAEEIIATIPLDELRKEERELIDPEGALR